VADAAISHSEIREQNRHVSGLTLASLTSGETEHVALLVPFERQRHGSKKTIEREINRLPSFEDSDNP
jgi:hypothetical protein